MRSIFGSGDWPRRDARGRRNEEDHFRLERDRDGARDDDDDDRDGFVVAVFIIVVVEFASGGSGWNATRNHARPSPAAFPFPSHAACG
jgi:hypothetical protein